MRSESLLALKGLCFIAERQACGGWLVNVLGAEQEPMPWRDVEAAMRAWLKEG